MSLSHQEAMQDDTKVPSSRLKEAVKRRGRYLAVNLDHMTYTVGPC